MGEVFSAMPKQRNHQHHHPHDYNEEDTFSWPKKWGRSFIYPKGYILPKFMRGKGPYKLPVPPLWGILLFFFVLMMVLIALLVQLGK